MSAPNLEVLAIGTAAYDFSLFIDEFPPENSKAEVYDLVEGGGGPAANAAYLLSMWGVRCGFAGLLGDDYYGRQIRSEFASVSTDLTLTVIRPGHPTAVSFILVNTWNGSRTIVNRKGQKGSLELSRSQLAGLSPGVLLFDGHEPGACRAARDAFPQAASILDAGSLRPGTRDLASQVDYLVASERFALQVTDLKNLTSIDQWQPCLERLRAIAKSNAQVVVTMGERGLIFDAAGTCRHLPAYPVRPVDTTGAGDVFHGAFTYGVLRGFPLEVILKLASVAAVLSVQKRGGRCSIPSLETVRKEYQHVEGRDFSVG